MVGELLPRPGGSLGVKPPSRIITVQNNKDHMARVIMLRDLVDGRMTLAVCMGGPDFIVVCDIC